MFSGVPFLPWPAASLPVHKEAARRIGVRIRNQHFRSQKSSPRRNERYWGAMRSKNLLRLFEFLAVDSQE